MLRYLYLNDVLNPERLTDLEQYENDFNFKNISFPVKLRKKNSNI